MKIIANWDLTKIIPKLSPKWIRAIYFVAHLLKVIRQNGMCAPALGEACGLRVHPRAEHCARTGFALSDAVSANVAVSGLAQHVVLARPRSESGLSCYRERVRILNG